MIISDFIGILEYLTNLIGLPFFSVLMGFLILALELFVFGVIILFAVRRIRKEMIGMNRKIDILIHLAEKEPAKKPVKESQIEPGKEPEKETESKKYRYKWK